MRRPPGAFVLGLGDGGASGPLSEGLAGWLGSPAGRSLAACGGTRGDRVGRVRSPVRF